jgi:hypothetical protein
MRVVVLSLVMTVLIAGCSSPAPEADCPSTFDDARTGNPPTAEGFVATGIVARYVNSPELEFRGYDVNVVRHHGGPFHPGTAFVRLPAPLAGISPGDAVLVLGERVGDGALILARDCPVLQRIEDAGRPGGG